MEELTPRQRAVLDLIRAWIDQKSYPPTVREIGAGLGMNSPYGVLRHLRELERKGYLKRSGKMRRTLTLVERTEVQDKTIPFGGKIS